MAFSQSMTYDFPIELSTGTTVTTFMKALSLTLRHKLGEIRQEHNNPINLMHVFYIPHHDRSTGHGNQVLKMRECGCNDCLPTTHSPSKRLRKNCFRTELTAKMILHKIIDMLPSSIPMHKLKSRIFVGQLWNIDSFSRNCSSFIREQQLPNLDIVLADAMI